MGTLQNENNRFRGYRSSKKLVDLAQAAATDLVPNYRQETLNETALELLVTPLTTLTETYVALTQHYRAQLDYRLHREG